MNSLHLTGNYGEIVIVDRGLTSHQRERLAPYCRITIPPKLDGWVKPAGYVPKADELAVLIDCDMMVTASLEPLLSDAAAGRIVAFADGWPCRRFEEWQAEFRLPEPPREQPYVNSGFVAFTTSRWPDLLRLWGEAAERTPGAIARHRHLTDDVHNPFVFRDQDALNAVLMTYVEREALAIKNASLAPIRKDADGVRVRDAARLECANGSQRTFLLHCTNRPKPWEPGAWILRPYSAYVDLLPRVLFGADVRLRLEPGEVPLWLRAGWLGVGTRDVLAATRRAWRAGKRVLPGRTRSAVHSALHRAARERR